MTSYIPDHREPMIRYYGFYNNVSRGLRQKKNQDILIPCVLEPEENARPNRNWARLIQKIYKADPLNGPKCQGLMRIISIIEDWEPVESLKVERVIDKILSHLGLYPAYQRPPTQPKALEFQIDFSVSRIPFYEEVLDPASGISTDHSAV